MTTMSADQCRKHPWERPDDVCRECRYGHCSECLVYVGGPNKPPLCVACALSLSGVNKSGRHRPRVNWFQARREARAAAREAEKAPVIRNEEPADTPAWASLDADVWDVDEPSHT